MQLTALRSGRSRSSDKSQVPRPFDLRQFLAQVAAQRNRTIYVHPFTSGPGIPCGLWLSTARADHIFHEQGTSPWHRTHIILHEIAHMLLGHDSGQGDGQRLADLLAPDVNPALVRLVLGRSAYGTAEERDAEALASLVLGQVTAVGKPPSREDRGCSSVRVPATCLKPVLAVGARRGLRRHTV